MECVQTIQNRNSLCSKIYICSMEILFVSNGNIIRANGSITYLNGNIICSNGIMIFVFIVCTIIKFNLSVCVC